MCASFCWFWSLFQIVNMPKYNICFVGNIAILSFVWNESNTTLGFFLNCTVGKKTYLTKVSLLTNCFPSLLGRLLSGCTTIKSDYYLPLHNIEEEFVCRPFQFGFLCLAKARQVDGECRLKTSSVNSPSRRFTFFSRWICCCHWIIIIRMMRFKIYILLLWVNEVPIVVGESPLVTRLGGKNHL